VFRVIHVPLAKNAEMKQQTFSKNCWALRREAGPRPSSREGQHSSISGEKRDYISIIKALRPVETFAMYMYLRSLPSDSHHSVNELPSLVTRDCVTRNTLGIIRNTRFAITRNTRIITQYTIPSVPVGYHSKHEPGITRYTTRDFQNLTSRATIKK